MKKFKVGDRVRVVTTNIDRNKCCHSYPGLTGVIVKADRDLDSDFPYCVKMDIYPTSRIWSKVEALNTNLIEVDYVELPSGDVKILAFKNLLSWQELEKKYGTDVTRRYEKGLHMWNGGNVGYALIVNENCPDTMKYQKFWVGQSLPYTCSRRLFDNLIIVMRMCGENLVKAVRDVRKEAAKEKAKIKTITI